MRIKAVYIIIGGENNYYCEQLFISLFSLKHYNPSIKAAVIMDEETDLFIKGHYKTLLTLIDELIIIPFKQSDSSIYRSRFLKSNMYDYINSDFLFLDTDTLVLGDISSIDDLNVTIGAVKDLHQENLSTCRYIDFINTMTRKIGWPSFSKKDAYYNSGILLVKRSDKSKLFFKEWHKNWLHSQKKGVNQDQLSLNFTNNSLQSIEDIPPIYHCQLLGNGLNYLLNARIIHYFNSSSGVNRTIKPFFLMNEEVYHLIRTSGKIPDNIKAQIINKDNFFSIQIDLITGENIDIFYSTTYKAISFIYRKLPRLFSILNISIDYIDKLIIKILSFRH